MKVKLLYTAVVEREFDMPEEFAPCFTDDFYSQEWGEEQEELQTKFSALLDEYEIKCQKIDANYRESIGVKNITTGDTYYWD